MLKKPCKFAKETHLLSKNNSICKGWKLKYVPSDGISKGYWTHIDRYHMMTKLCRYGSPMWPEYKFTWWDKLRFKWITGYKYEEVK